MTYHDISWHIMIYQDKSWHIATHYDISWHTISSIMRYHDIPSHLITNNEISRHTMTYHNVLWHIMTYNDISLQILRYHDISWHIMTYPDISWHDYLQSVPLGRICPFLIFMLPPSLRILYCMSIETRDLEPFHSIEKYRVSNPQHQKSSILKNCDFLSFFAEKVVF